MPRLALRAFLLAATAVAAPASFAQEIGTAGAVNPAATGTPPSRGTRVIELGSRVVFRERIATTAGGTVQLVFLDKTTMSIGPNSTVTVDEFVYDPNAGTGRLTASMAKGVLRFVGGNTSHSGGAQIKTPSATLGIRGGVATVEVNPCAPGAAGASCGTKVTNHFGVLTITSAAGTEVIRRPGFVVAIPSPASAPSAPRRVTQAEVDQSNSSLTSKPGQTGGAGNRASEAAVNRANVAGPVIAAILPATASIQAQTQARQQNAATTIGLSVSPTDATTASQVQIAVADVRQQVTQQVTQVVPENPIQPPIDPPIEPPPPPPPPPGGGASGQAFALASTNLVGGRPAFVLGYADGGTAENRPNTSARLLAGGLGGLAGGELTVATGRTALGENGRAVFEGGFTSIARQQGAFLREATDLAAAGSDVALDSAYAANTINARVGRLDSAGNVVPGQAEVAVYAPRRSVSTADRTLAPLNRVATPAGLGVDRPAINSVPNSNFGGNVGGLVSTVNNTTGAVSPTTTVSGLFDLTFDPRTSRFGTTLGIDSSNADGNGLTQALLDFGSPVDSFYERPATQDGRGTFVDYRNFGAREAKSADGATFTSTVNGRAVTDHRGVFVTADTVNARQFFPNVAFCQCEFTRWGFWSSETTRTTASGQSVTDLTHLGTWVFGPPAESVDIPRMGTATYDGHAVATIRNGTSEYVAGGNFRNVVNFGNGTGAATVSNLDGRSYAGNVSLSGQNFSGSLATTAGATAAMSLDGQFSRGRAGPAGEMLGSLSITGQNYLGSGIFAGATPTLPTTAP